jgi:hypothetical protein
VQSYTTDLRSPCTVERCPPVGLAGSDPEAVRAEIVEIAPRTLRGTVELGDLGDVREVVILGSAARPFCTRVERRGCPQL